MRNACYLLLLVCVGSVLAVGPIPSPTCPPGIKNCVPPSPPSASVSGEYPIEVTSALPKETWKKDPFGAPVNYVVSLAADKTPVTCTSPASITSDEHGLVTSCTSTPPSPAAGFYSYPSNLLVSSEGLVESVENSTTPPLNDLDAGVGTYVTGSGTSRAVNTYVATVKDFGALGDGTTDDTVAIQTALNSVKTAGGGELYFPAGTYIISSLGLNSAYNITLSGAGMASTLKRLASATTGIASMLAFSSSTHIRIRNLNFVTTNYMTESSSLYRDNCITASSSTDFIVENCFFYPGWASAVLYQSVAYGAILDNLVYGVPFDPSVTNTSARSAAALAVVDNSNHVSISRNQVAAGGASCILAQAIANNSVISDIIIEDNIVGNCGGYGIIVYDNNLNTNGTGYVSDVIVSANTVNTVYGSVINAASGSKDFGACIYMQGPLNSRVVSNIVSYCSIQTNNSLLTPAAIGVTNTYTTSIVGNTISYSVRYGIMSTPGFATVTGSSLISQNTIYCGASYCNDSAVYLQDVSYISLIGNSIFSPPTHGINVRKTGTTCQVILVQSNVIKTSSLTNSAFINQNCDYVSVISNTFWSDSNSGTALFFSTGTWALAVGNTITRFAIGVRVGSSMGVPTIITNNIVNSANSPFLFDRTVTSYDNNAGFGSGSNELIQGTGSPMRSATVASNQLDARGAYLLNVDASANPTITSLINGYPTQIVTVKNAGTSGSLTFTNSSSLLLNGVTSLVLATGDTVTFICTNLVSPQVWQAIGRAQPSATGVSSIAGTTGQISASASTGPVTLSFPPTWAPTVSTMSFTASGPQMRTYMDTSTEWGVYDNSVLRNVLSYERTYRAITFGQRLMVEEEGTIGTSISLFGGACNPSPFSFGGSVTLAGSQSIFKITLVTGSGTCASSSAAFQFLWTWTGANVVVCTATPQTSTTIDVPIGLDASPTNFVLRVGSVPFNSGQTYVWNVMCVGTATQTLFEDEE